MSSGKPEIALRHLLLPLGLVLAVVLRWQLGWSKGTTFAVALFFVGFSFVLGPLVGRRKAAFDRALIRTLQRGVKNDLWPLYRRSWFIRAFAEKRYLSAKRGLIHAELGEPEAAARAFREALVDAPEKERPLLETYLANALYAQGDDAEAGRRYRKLLADGVDVPLVYHHLAHGILRRGGKPKEAVKLLEKGLETAGAGPVAMPLRITLAEAFAALRDPDRARKLLDQAPVSTGPLAARRALVEGKVAAAAGEESAARKCYARAESLDPDGPSGREARALLERAA